jgi:hypothetical protein
MKKLIVLLILLGCLTSCAPKYWFFTKAAHPTDRAYRKSIRREKRVIARTCASYDDVACKSPLFNTKKR